MPSPAVPLNQPERKAVGDYPELRRKLSLICGGCGKKGKYAVGRVFVDSRWIKKERDEEISTLDAAISFSGIFVCKHCGADGPWGLPFMTSTALLFMLSAPSAERGEWGVQIGQLQMFDGTITRTGAAAERYLKQKIEEQPENAYLWGRLGNFYEHAGFLDLAKAAFEKAVELDESEYESQYSLGAFRRDEGDDRAAALCFEAAIRHASSAPHGSPALKQKLVRACLEDLFDLHKQSAGQIRFPPAFTFHGQAPTANAGPSTLASLELDLSSDEDWNALATIYLTGEVPEPIRRRAVKASERRSASQSQLGFPAGGDPGAEEATGTIRQAKPPGRNDPCPCGSGKKYKRCCLPK